MHTEGLMYLVNEINLATSKGVWINTKFSCSHNLWYLIVSIPLPITYLKGVPLKDDHLLRLTLRTFAGMKDAKGTRNKISGLLSYK